MKYKKYTIDTIQEVVGDRPIRFISKEYAGMTIKYDWQCNICSSTWQARPNDIRRGASKCLHCVGKKHVEYKKYTTESIHKLVNRRSISFISQTYTRIDLKYSWKCDICNHEWQATLHSVQNQQTGCPKCAGKAYTKEEIIEAADRRKILMTGIFTKMTDKTEWTCADGHTWSASPFSVVTRGTGCPKCKSNINEEKCRFIFQSLTCHEFPKNRKILSGKELDGYCSELNIAFEYQGEQHYKEMYFHRPGRDLKIQQERDKQKRNMCEKLGVTLIEIPYTEKQKEHFIARELEKYTSIIGQVNWGRFSFHTNYLSELKKILLSRDIQCSSKSYLGDGTKLELECMVCSHLWKAAPTHLKGKNPTGCPRCNKSAAAIKRESKKRANRSFGAN